LIAIQFTILAVDPGSMKCGLAVVTNQITVLNKRTVDLRNLTETVRCLCAEYAVSVIVIGDGTHSKIIRSDLTTSLKLPVVMVNEDKSSLEGRYRYLKENSRGLARILPIGLRVPREPYDDYVAVILAERFFKKYPDFAPGKPLL
jgi:RNase H-fold protein (predicted Holliday junction resolvase)